MPLNLALHYQFGVQNGVQRKIPQKDTNVKKDLTSLSLGLGDGEMNGGSVGLLQIDNMGNEGKQISQILEDISEQLNNVPSETQEEDQSSLELIESHLQKNYDFRYNIVSGRLEYKKNKKQATSS